MKSNFVTDFGDRKAADPIRSKSPCYEKVYRVFTAEIWSANTRKAHAHEVQANVNWCELNSFRVLQDIKRVQIAAYIETLQTRLAGPSVKQHLAAIRMLFNYLVVGQVIAVNPASPDPGPKHTKKN